MFFCALMSSNLVPFTPFKNTLHSMKADYQLRIHAVAMNVPLNCIF